jgi:zinc protease
MKAIRNSQFLIFNSRKLALICGYVFLLLAKPFDAAQGRPPVVPDTGTLNIEVPSFDIKVLSCGIKVIFLKNDEMPLVQAELFIPGGFVADPDGKEGLVSLMNSSLRNGGAGKLTPEAFDSALENKAASMSASADMEHYSAEFKCLSQDLPDVLDLFADMLRHPLFDAKRLETDKADLLDSLSRLTDTPDALTRVLFYRSLMGHSPYGRWANPKSVAALTREDVVKFYEKNYGPQGAVLAIAGNFDENKVFQQLEGLFAGWKGQGNKAIYSDAKPLGPTIYFYPKDVGQVFIRFGLLGIQRHDPRDIPLQVANYILGGSGFTSRMMQDIRSDRGLAYFVYSYSIPYDVRGVYQVVGGTRPDSVKEYLTELFKQVDDFAKDGPTNTELANAKQSLIEEYAYNFESSYSLASYKATLDFNGYPEDYLKTYRDQVKAVTREEATKAAQDILSQKDWVLVVSGPAPLEQELSSFGKVVKVSDIFGPLASKP